MTTAKPFTTLPHLPAAARKAGATSISRMRVAVAINQLMLSERWYDLPAEDRARLYDALELGRYPEIGKDFAPRLLRALDARRQRRRPS